MKTEQRFANDLAAVLASISENPPYWCRVHRPTLTRPRATRTKPTRKTANRKAGAR
jgi:hypothetical protein